METISVFGARTEGVCLCAQTCCLYLSCGSPGACGVCVCVCVCTRLRLRLCLRTVCACSLGGKGLICSRVKRRGGSRGLCVCLCLQMDKILNWHRKSLRQMSTSKSLQQPSQCFSFFLNEQPPVFEICAQ